MSELKVSIIIPVLNEEANIERLLLSLARLDYPRKDLEVIIVDNGSTDSTREIVSKFPCRLLVELKRSSYSARNLGISRSKGNVIAFTDGDCVVTRSWIRDLIQGFDRAEIGGVAGTITPLEAGTLVQRFQSWIRIPAHDAGLRPYPYAVTANVAYRREVFEKVGMFDDDDFRGGGDVDFAIRMQKLGNYSLRFLTGSGVVFHRNERNFFTLMDHAMGYGYGYYFLSKKHVSDYPGADQRLNLGVQILPLMKRAAIAIAQTLRSAGTPGDIFTSVLFESMRVLWDISFIRGILTAHKQAHNK